MPSKGLNIKVPRLGVNRFGVYYVRSSAPDAAGQRTVVIQRSLRTKNPQIAKRLALQYCLDLLTEDQLSQYRTGVDHYEFDVNRSVVRSTGRKATRVCWRRPKRSGSCWS